MVWYGMVCMTLPDLLAPSLLLHTSYLVGAPTVPLRSRPLPRGALQYLWKCASFSLGSGLVRNAREEPQGFLLGGWSPTDTLYACVPRVQDDINE